jgi:hypothetical protein
MRRCPAKQFIRLLLDGDCGAAIAEHDSLLNRRPPIPHLREGHPRLRAPPIGRRRFRVTRPLMRRWQAPDDPSGAEMRANVLPAEGAKTVSPLRVIQSVYAPEERQWPVSKRR